jgi:predicted RNase H-like HicB family nuclease
MKHLYPAVFRPEREIGFFVFFPDINMGGTQGKDVKESIEMAEDFLAGALCAFEDTGEEFPVPSDIKALQLQEGDIATFVVANPTDYRRRNENKVIKKTLTIPSWLNALAEDAKINFSQTLQSALKEHLGVSEPTR